MVTGNLLAVNLDWRNTIKCVTNSSPQYPIKVPVNTKLLDVQSGNYLKFFRSMVGVKPRNSCRYLFKWPTILPVPCEYIFSLMSFIVNNQ